MTDCVYLPNSSPVATQSRKQEAEVNHKPGNPSLLRDEIGLKCKVFKMGGIDVSFPPGKLISISKVMQF